MHSSSGRGKVGGELLDAYGAPGSPTDDSHIIIIIIIITIAIIIIIIIIIVIIIIMVIIIIIIIRDLSDLIVSDSRSADPRLADGPHSGWPPRS